MRLILFLIGVVVITYSLPVKAQNKLDHSTGLVYIGGVDSLDKHLSKNLRNKVKLISDCFFFFKISLPHRGDFIVEELYGETDQISRIAKEAIRATANNWIRPQNDTLNVVVPFFLINEKEDQSVKPTGYANFKMNRNMVSCILFPPIVYTYYLSSH